MRDPSPGELKLRAPCWGRGELPPSRRGEGEFRGVQGSPRAGEGGGEQALGAGTGRGPSKLRENARGAAGTGAREVPAGAQSQGGFGTPGRGGSRGRGEEPAPFPGSRRWVRG